jgi:hypothetical protein
MMRRTELNQQTTEILAEISPPIYSIRITLQPPRTTTTQNNNSTVLRHHTNNFPSQVQSDILSLLGIMFMPSNQEEIPSLQQQPASLQNSMDHEYEFNVVTYSSL